MAVFVLDASVTLAWVIPDEALDAKAKLIARRLARDSAAVPLLWRMEVGNGLLMAERRGRITIEEIEKAWRDLDAIPIEADPDTLTHAWGRSAALARTHRLTLYDAAYLELALRLVLPLATFDAPLTRAAVAEGVELITT